MTTAIEAIAIKQTIKMYSVMPWPRLVVFMAGLDLTLRATRKALKTLAV